MGRANLIVLFETLCLYREHDVSTSRFVGCKIQSMPKLWNDTIDTHRLAVRNAILDAAARLAEQHGLSAVTMLAVAETAGIGRATLYKYFTDLPAVLAAWHERHVAEHLRQFHQVIDDDGRPILQRLEWIVMSFARMSFLQRGSGMAAMLHASDHARHSKQHLSRMLGQLIQEAVNAGHVRTDVPAEELAVYCLSSLGGAADLPSDEAVDRLVAITLSTLQPNNRSRSRQFRRTGGSGK